MFCGDRLAISLTPSLLTSTSFQIEYQLYSDVGDGEKQAIANALTKHICIDPNSRTKCDLSTDLLKWLGDL
jgi:1,4-dihydroxy-2-naphthoyl-CoA hydrolase